MGMEISRPLGWTTLEEAKQLVEAGLPVETADMYWAPDVGTVVPTPYITKTDNETFIPAYKEAIPCWSLGALISLLPLSFQSKEGFNYEYFLHFDILDEIKLTYYIKQIRYGHPMVAEKCETLIEACVEIITWLLNNKFYEQEKC